MFLTSPTTSSNSSSPCSRWALPLKSSLSPPTTTSPTDYFSLTLSPPARTTPFSPASPGTLSCAYPSWPNRASLSPSSPSTLRSGTYGLGSGGACPNSYISDEDLAECGGWSSNSSSDEDLELPGLVQECALGISWSATRQPEVVVGEERRRRVAFAPVVVEKRKVRSRSRSSSKGKRGSSGGRTMATINE